MYALLNKPTLADVTEDKLFDYIKENSLQPGNPLPKEEELAEMFQVSRRVVREALSRLQFLGVLSSRKRRGIVLEKPKVFDALSRVIDPFFYDEAGRKDFMMLRFSMEVGMVEILLKNITPEEVEELEEIVAEEEADPADYALYMNCDYRFHATIYKATGSRSLEAFQMLLYRFFSENLKKHTAHSPANYANRFNEPKTVSHRTILEAIRAGDPERLRALIREHISWVDRLGDVK